MANRKYFFELYKALTDRPMEEIKKLKKFYKDQANNTCLKICRTKEVLQIILIRHAKPKISKKSFISFEEAESHLNDYRNSTVHTDFESPVCTEDLTGVKVYHSDLRRSRETARRLFPSEKFTLIEDERFRELDRENIRTPFKTPYKLHTGLSRIAWLTGRMRNAELPREAWKRLRNNAAYLDVQVKKEKTLIIVAHGFHNLFAGIFLKSLGYSLVKNGGHKHLSVNIWAKAEKKD